MGRASEGLLQLVAGSLLPFGAPEGLPEGETSVLYRDRDGVLWAGSRSGTISRLQGTRFAEVASAGAPVSALAGSKDGRLWVATSAGGLQRLEDGRLSPVSAATMGRIPVSGLYEDPDGALWIGTVGRHLLRFAHGTLDMFGPTQGSLTDAVYTMLGSASGALWVGTAAGLYRFAGQKRTWTGLAGQQVVALHEDREATLWVGTRDSGLHRLKDGKLAAITTRDGLCDDSILGIAADDHSNL